MADRVERLKALVLSRGFTQKKLAIKIGGLRNFIPTLEDAHYKYMGTITEQDMKQKLKKELFRALDSMDAILEPAEDEFDTMAVETQEEESKDTTRDDFSKKNEAENIESSLEIFIGPDKTDEVSFSVDTMINDFLTDLEESERNEVTTADCPNYDELEEENNPRGKEEKVDQVQETPSNKSVSNEDVDEKQSYMVDLVGRKLKPGTEDNVMTIKGN